MPPRPNHHPLIGRAKDVAAGAVLLAAIDAVGVAARVFLARGFCTLHEARVCGGSRVSA